VEGMFQKYEPLFAIESAMGPTIPMLLAGPLRRIKLTSFPGVVTVHYIQSAKAFAERYQDIKGPASNKNIADCGAGNWVNHYASAGKTRQRTNIGRRCA